MLGDLAIADGDSARDAICVNMHKVPCVIHKNCFHMTTTTILTYILPVRIVKSFLFGRKRNFPKFYSGTIRTLSTGLFTVLATW